MTKEFRKNPINYNNFNKIVTEDIEIISYSNFNKVEIIEKNNKQICYCSNIDKYDFDTYTFALNEKVLNIILDYINLNNVTDYIIYKTSIQYTLVKKSDKGNSLFINTLNNQLELLSQKVRLYEVNDTNTLPKDYFQEYRMLIDNCEKLLIKVKDEYKDKIVHLSGIELSLYKAFVNKDVFNIITKEDYDKFIEQLKEFRESVYIKNSKKPPYFIINGIPFISEETDN